MQWICSNIENKKVLTLKVPRKPAYFYVVSFQTYFCIQANSLDPDQTAPRSSLIWVHTVCKNDFSNHKQMTKQMTIVVTGNLRVKVSEYSV